MELGKLEAELEEKTRKWSAFPRTTEEERNAAEEYYEQEIMPLLRELFVKREASKLGNRYEALILSLGTSWQPLVLSISAINPKKVLILYTEESRPLLDKVWAMTGLSAAQVETTQVDEQNPLEIYEAVKKAYERWGKPRHIAIDFTGGTKAMSGGCAMAGALIDADLFYVGYQRYMKDLRRPYPGSEQLVLIPNPYEVFGDLEERRGIQLLSEYDYAGAKLIFARLERHVPDPRRPEILRLLAEAYGAWDNMNFIDAADVMQQLVARVEQYSRMDKNFLLSRQLPLLREQQRVLEILSSWVQEKKKKSSLQYLLDKEVVVAVMMVLYSNALRREKQNKLDMATLLLYRLLEMISQASLAVYGIDTAAPDYSQVSGIAVEELQNYYRQLCQRYKSKDQALPAQIALFDGYLLLAALKDPLVEGLNLKRLRQQIEIRNNNVFAHGFDFIKPKSYSLFKEMVNKLLRKYLEGRQLDMERLEQVYQFLDIASEVG
ncbi:MAG: TIGR02710 family CRISPR-associated protein [Thermoanaerobacteraceae bacterium]|nr:TIGR02710 family CRISPR-associated protein [Thermoanaerobacteraceae bacterium]